MTATGGSGSGLNPWRVGGWSLAAIILATPLAAMRFTDEVNWTGSDFLFAGLLIGGAGLILELTVRRSSSPAYRAGVAFAVAAAVFIAWAIGAVGMIGDEGEPYNFFFGLVVVAAVLGSILARFRPAGMAAAMATVGAAQIALGVAGLSIDAPGGA